MDRRNYHRVATITEQELTCLRRNIGELRQQTAEQLQAFQGEAKTYTTQLNRLATQTNADSDRIMELAKLEAFDQWI